VPFYAFQTSLTDGDVLFGARAFIHDSKIPAARSVLVNRSATTSHIDPLTASPAKNDLLKTVEPFLHTLQ
jgi:hypothetical protein